METDNAKILDVNFDPCEMIKIEEIKLHLEKNINCFQYRFKIQTIVKEKYEGKILNGIEYDPIKALIKTETLKKYDFIIYSRKISKPTDAPLETSFYDYKIEMINLEYNKGNILLGCEEYSEKIKICFKIILFINLVDELIPITQNKFSYDIYFRNTEADIDRVIVLEDLQATVINE